MTYRSFLSYVENVCWASSCKVASLCGSADMPWALCFLGLIALCLGLATLTWYGNTLWNLSKWERSAHISSSLCLSWISSSLILSSLSCSWAWTSWGDAIISFGVSLTTGWPFCIAAGFIMPASSSSAPCCDEKQRASKQIRIHLTGGHSRTNHPNDEGSAKADTLKNSNRSLENMFSEKFNHHNFE